MLTAFPNGTSAKCKQENWRLLQRVAAKRDIFFEEDMIRKIMQVLPSSRSGRAHVNGGSIVMAVHQCIILLWQLSSAVDNAFR